MLHSHLQPLICFFYSVIEYSLIYFLHDSILNLSLNYIYDAADEIFVGAAVSYLAGSS